MTETLGPAAELDAVNEMLAAISEAPLPSITNLSVAGTVALATLRSTSRDLQEVGWNFNREKGVTIAIDGSGFLNVPSDCLKIDGTESINYTERNRMLYNLDANTFVSTVSAVVDLVRHLPWAQLPSVVRRYVTALAIEQFQAAYPPPQELVQSAARKLARAQSAFHTSELENADLNVITMSTHVSNIMSRLGI